MQYVVLLSFSVSQSIDLLRDRNWNWIALLWAMYNIHNKRFYRLSSSITTISFFARGHNHSHNFYNEAFGVRETRLWAKGRICLSSLTHFGLVCHLGFTQLVPRSFQMVVIIKSFCEIEWKIWNLISEME